MLKEYLLSPMQRGMIFHSLRSPHTGVYINQYIFDLPESLDINPFQNSWQQVIDLYDVLRTSFVIKKAHLTQLVHKKVDANWKIYRLDEYDENYINELLKSDAKLDFDLELAPLYRFTLFYTKKHSKFVFTFHHAILDGRSGRIVIEKVFQLYDATNKKLQISTSPTYNEYLLWLENLNKKNAIQNQSFWKEYLHHSNYTCLPSQNYDKNLDDYKSQEILLSKENTAALKKLCLEQNITMNTILKGVWAFILYKYTGEKNICFDTTRSLRDPKFSGIENVVGVFINTVPFRVTICPEETMCSWLQKIRQQWLTIRLYETIPLYQIFQWCEKSSHPIGSSVVVFENRPRNIFHNSKRTCLRRSKTNYDITLMGYDEAQFAIKIAYSSHFKQQFINDVLEHIHTLCNSIPANINKTLQDQTIFSLDQEKKLVVDWNNTTEKFCFERQIVELFEEQVDKSPEKVCVNYGMRNFTFSQINMEANQFSNYLQAQGITKGDFVVICLPRSPQMVISIIAILKSGGAYISLDVNQPEERLKQMVVNSGTKYIVTLKTLETNFRSFPVTTICIDTIKDLLQKMEESNPVISTSIEDIAYVVYTSGSTGSPKGILISHKSLLNHTFAIIKKYQIQSSDRRLQFSSPGSDVLIAEIFPYLLCGGTIVIPTNQKPMSIIEFTHMLEQQRVTITGLPSAYWDEWVNAITKNTLRFPSYLRIVLTGMDKVRANSVNAWKEKVPNGVRLFNVYGPSEATGTSTVYEIDISTTEKFTSIPIGTPIANVTIYILDNDENLVPQGAIGEICVGGFGVSKGYLNLPQLTQQKFIANHFTGEGFIYKTGDLGYYRPDANIEFIGRKDHQVKIRGFRVELCEIENVLNELDCINNSIAKVHGEENEKRIVAYIIPNGTISEEKIYFYLHNKLPNYMMPADFIFLDHFPLLPSGKVDRNQLQQPQFSPKSKAMPRNFQERVICNIFEELLGKKDIGIFDNFFHIGGHSLLIYPLLQKIEDELGVTIPATIIFDHPSISLLARKLEAICGDDHIAIVKQGFNPPLICVHAAEGSGLNYWNLVTEINNTIAIINAPREKEHFKNFDSIEKIASYYIESILKTIPSKEYALIGHSFGGTIAYEMAKQFKDQDIKVLFLGMLDTIILDYIPHVAKEEWFDILPDKTRTFARQQLSLQKKYFARPHSYNGKIHLFRVHRDNKEIPEDYGWRKFSQSEVSIYHLKGNHSNIIGENSKIIASIIHKNLPRVLVEEYM